VDFAITDEMLPGYNAGTPADGSSDAGDGDENLYPGDDASDDADDADRYGDGDEGGGERRRQVAIEVGDEGARDVLRQPRRAGPALDAGLTSALPDVSALMAAAQSGVPMVSGLSDPAQRAALVAVAALAQAGRRRSWALP
jgi:hypothetical protein